MILQALTQYYERKSESESGALPPLGWLNLPVDYILEIDKSGALSQVVPCFEVDGKRRKRKEFPLPAIGKQAIKHTNAGNDPNLLWDNAGFLLGVADADATEAEKEKAQTKLSHFMSLLKVVFERSNDEGIQAVFGFYEQNGHSNPLIADEEISKSDTVTFRLNSDNMPVLHREAVQSMVNDYLEMSEETFEGVCLVSGENTLVSKNHYSIKNVSNSDGPLVSFNKAAFKSHGRENGAISPVGHRAMVAYTTALNHLLRKGSEQRIQVGDAAVVFWSEKETSLEKNIGSIFGGAAQEKEDDPDRTNAIRAIYKAVYRGRPQVEDEHTRFYVLGLSPNKSRIAIRFWHVATVGEVATRIKRHFDDLRIVRAPHEQEYLSLSLLLIGIAAKAKSEREKKRFGLAEKQPYVAESLMKDLLKKGRLPPSLAGELLKSALEGTPYPHTLLAAAVRRNKAEQKVTYPRAAIIKASLNRFHKREEIQMALDKSNPNPGYRLGRLFAALEKIQEDAAKPNRLNATIRDRYYGAASSSPVSVFSTLLKLKNHHLAKLSRGEKVQFEKLIGEIMSELPDSFAANLSLKDQGRFAVGYYHQRQDFFTPRKTPETGDES